MKKIISLFLLPICALSYSINTLASKCDGSTLNILNLSGKEVAVSSVISDGKSSISSVSLGEARKGFNFTVRSGVGTLGDASGQITLSYVDNPTRSIVLTYKFSRRVDLWSSQFNSIWGTHCYPSLTVSGMPSSAYQILSSESGTRDKAQTTLFLND